MKNLKTIGLILLIFSLTSGWCQDKKSISIGLLGDKLSPTYSASIKNLQDEIRAVVGEEAEVTFKQILLNNFDISRAESNYRQLVNDDTDIILAFGLINNMFLYSEPSIPIPTLAHGGVISDLIDLPDDQNATNRNNINFILAPISYTEDLNAFYQVYDYKSIGIIVDEIMMNNLPLKNFFDSYFADRSIEYRFLPIDDAANQLNASLDGIDAVYVAGGFYLDDTDFSNIIQAINDRELPSFSALGIRDLERGVLATNQSDTYIDNFIRRIALHIEAVIKGTNPSELPQKLDYKKQLTLNFVTAMNIGFPLRYSSLAKINFMGEVKENEFVINYSLADIMSKVVTANVSLSAERKNIDLDAQDVKIAKSNFLPGITANADGLYIDPKLAEISNGSNPEFSTSGNVQLSQTIYSEEAAANVTITEKQLQAEIQNFNATELDAILNGGIAYFNALIFKSNLRIQSENLKATRKNLNIAELNFEVGESSKYDELRFKSELASNTQNFLNAYRDFIQSLFTINQLLNNPIDLDIDLQDIDLNQVVFSGYTNNKLKELLDNPTTRPKVIQFLVEEAKRNSPELKSISYSTEANERILKLNSTGRFIPTVNLQGQYSHEFSRSGKGTTYPDFFGIPPDGTFNVGLNVSLPLFQRNQRNINKQTAIIQQDQLDLYRQDTELAIEKNINDIVAEIMNRIANIEIAKVAEEAAQQALLLTQSSYAEGESLLIELVDSQNTHLEAQLASANANYNFLLAGLTLERAMGLFFLLKTDDENLEFMRRVNQFILEKN